MWRDGRYRQRSPAVDAAEPILTALGTFRQGKPGYQPWVVDVGTGCGRIMPVLAGAGYRPFGYDACDNCLDAQVAARFPLVVGDITEITSRPPLSLRPADLCLCIDVLEHIPEPMLDAALGQLSRCASIGAVISASSLEDSGKLHCTIRDAKWWLAKLGEFWPSVTQVDTGKYHDRQTEDNWFLFRCAHEQKSPLVLPRYRDTDDARQASMAVL